MERQKSIPQGLKPALILPEFYGMAEAMPFQNGDQTEFVNALSRSSEQLF